ncbi:hypothetical protein N7517_006602 [Penicillium concentricum]|uniref:TauD/TfdA-like domain-containing protein n=1 Tax=Penicillium concentricum TaxID=293559 RepID=A0A9W9S9K7_9EURO|nr:uncharacterized protein N7517_006602 [Penicillium concentricum]KAJ5374596.1 hypothetical protein N7517_006602 [Penicillium concentricum]
MNRLFRAVPTARVTAARYSTQPIRDQRISSLVPLINIAKPAFASDASHLREVHENLDAHGVVQVQLGFSDEDSTYLQRLISNLHKNHNHGLPITHSAERGWFWDVRPSPASFQSHGHQARSETMSQFEWHTDCSYEEQPPRFFALQVLQPDRCGGGTLSVLNVDRLLTLLSPFAQQWLSSRNYKITVPPEFTKTVGKQHIVGNLLAVKPGNSGSQLRFREDITVPLTPNAAKALDELKEILYGGAREETLHLTPQSLPQGSIIMMDNRRWLHSRNEVKDPNRHLRRVRWAAFPDDVDYSPVSSEGLDVNLLSQNRTSYISRLNNCSSSWPAGSVDASCPCPVLTTQRHDDELRNLHLALKLAIEDIIERWWTDEEARFPLRMPLEQEEEDLLRWMHSNRDLFPSWNERQGSWRPDFLVEKDEAGMEVFRICEINARFCWNGYMHAGFGQEALSAFNIESRGLTHAVEAETILGGLLELFDINTPLHLVKGEEHGIDISMFIEFAQKRLGIKLRLITPDTLRLIPDSSPSGKDGYKLCCLAEADAVDTITTESGEIVEEIHQIGLELHQREINALDQEMKRQISLRCFNDMQTILLAHDKRMLGLILEELDSLITRSIITPQQAEWLERGLAHTVLPGSTGLNKFIENCKASDVFQNEYLLKPIRGGKGAGILFGDEVGHSDWLALLEPMQCPRLKSGKTLYVVQRKVHQPYYNVLLGSNAKSERCHMVGTYHAVNGHFLGLGIWRCSPGRLCAISNGATWMCSVKQS